MDYPKSVGTAGFEPATSCSQSRWEVGIGMNQSPARTCDQGSSADMNKSACQMGADSRDVCRADYETRTVTPPEKAESWSESDLIESPTGSWNGTVTVTEIPGLSWLSSEAEPFGM